MIGLAFPSLVSPEVLHYGYALVMLLALWALRPGFTGRAGALVVDAGAGHPVLPPLRACAAAMAGAQRPQPVRPADADQHRAALGAAVELHLFYNTIVFVPMIVGMHATTCSRRKRRRGGRGAPAHGTAAASPHPSSPLPAGLFAAGLLLAASLAGACTRQPAAADDTTGVLVTTRLMPQPTVGPATLTVSLSGGTAATLGRATVQVVGHMTHPGMHRSWPP